ncbi:MAG TPA: hypothetical protein VHA37_09700, partial [Candidatus Saccharimonadales bacterium]|nr:hypothetical protein [Candidatus Saccharimonadales bacterium]
MAAESKQKKEAAKPTAAAAEQVHVGDGGKLPHARRLRQLRKPRVGKKTRLALYALVVVIVLGGGYWLAKDVFHIGEKVYAQAAGHKVYKKEIDQLRGSTNTKGLSDHDVATVLANKYLYQAMAKKAGITVTDQDVEDQYPNVSPNHPNAYVWQDDVNGTYASQLMAYNTGLYKGKVLVAYFNRYVAFQSSLLPERQALEPLIGNQAAIAADRKYASTFINKMYNQLKSHKITFDQAIQAQKKDPTLGNSVYSPQSGSFDTSNPYLGGTVLVGPKSAQAQLAKMKAGQLSKPFVVSVRNSWKDPNVTAPAYYLVVQMDYSKSSHSGLTWDKYLAQQQN